MPIYEYECNACGKHSEILQKINDQPAIECPKCNAKSLKRLVSAPQFQLKGTGWYVTDFRDKNKPRKEESKETSKKTEAPKKETKD